MVSKYKALVKAVILGIDEGIHSTLSKCLCGMITGGFGVWALFILEVTGCRDELRHILRSHPTDEIDGGGESSGDLEPNDNCNTGDLYLILALFVVIVLGSLGFFIFFFCVCFKESRKRYKCFIRKQQYKNTGALRTSSKSNTFDPNAHVMRMKKHRYLTEVSQGESSCPVNNLVNRTWTSKTRHGGDTTALDNGGLKVKQVLIVRNEKLMKKYKKEKVRMSKSDPADLPDELKHKPILTAGTIEYGQTGGQQVPLMESSLDTDIHEVYLFHGTKLECVPNIIEHGFDLKRARSGRYGKAIYLAESSEKADKYTDYSKNRRNTDLAMLLVRVPLGKIRCHKEDSPVTIPSSNQREKFDSVMAGFNTRFREFLVFDDKKLYPEFVIIYDRSS